MTSRKPPEDEHPGPGSDHGPERDSQRAADQGADVVDFTAFRARRDEQTLRARRDRADHGLPSAAELAEATQHPAGSGTRDQRAADRSRTPALRAVADVGADSIPGPSADAALELGAGSRAAAARPIDAQHLRERLRAMEQRATVSRLPAAAAAAQEADDAAALQLGLKLLGSRDLTRRELRDRLKSHEVADEAAQRAVSELWSRGLIDELDIARRVVEVGTSRRHVGAARLRQELRARGVGAADIEHALAEVDADSELEAAVSVARQRLRGLRDVDEQTRRRRVLASLQRKGFPSDLCRRAYSEALDSL
ncbi:MAG: regulatory protein RecX [Pseudoclavibacter sp.]